jgi:hypothetical protein
MVSTNSPHNAVLQGPPKEILLVQQKPLARSRNRHSTGSLRNKVPTSDASQDLSCSSQHSRRIPRSDAYRNYRRKCHYLMARDRCNSQSSGDSSSTDPTEPSSTNDSTKESPGELRCPIKSHPDLMPLNTLAMLVSQETTRAVKIGLYSTPDMGTLRRQRETHGLKKRETMRDIFELPLPERKATKTDGRRPDQRFSNIMGDVLDALVDSELKKRSS